MWNARKAHAKMNRQNHVDLFLHAAPRLSNKIYTKLQYNTQNTTEKKMCCALYAAIRAHYLNRSSAQAFFLSREGCLINDKIIV